MSTRHSIVTRSTVTDTIIETVQILLPYFSGLLHQVFIEGWLKMPLDNVRKLYDSTPRRIEAVLKAEGGPNSVLNLFEFDKCASYSVHPLQKTSVSRAKPRE